MSPTNRLTKQFRPRVRPVQNKIGRWRHLRCLHFPVGLCTKSWTTNVLSRGWLAHGSLFRDHIRGMIDGRDGKGHCPRLPPAASSPGTSWAGNAGSGYIYIHHQCSQGGVQHKMEQWWCICFPPLGRKYIHHHFSSWYWAPHWEQRWCVYPGPTGNPSSCQAWCKHFGSQGCYATATTYLRHRPRIGLSLISI